MGNFSKFPKSKKTLNVAHKKVAAPTKALAKPATKPVQPKEPDLAPVPPDAASLRKQIRDIWADVVGHMVVLVWQIGRLVNAARSEPKKYGKQIAQEIAADLNVKTSTLYDYGRIANCFSHAEITSLASQRMKNNCPLEYSHVRALSLIQDPVEREQMRIEVVRRSLPARAIAAKIKDGGVVADDQRKDTLRRFKGAIEAAVKLKAELYESVFAKLENPDASSVDLELAMLMSDVIKILPSAEQLVRESNTRLRTAAKSVQAGMLQEVASEGEPITIDEPQQDDVTEDDEAEDGLEDEVAAEDDSDFDETNLSDAEELVDDDMHVVEEVVEE